MKKLFWVLTSILLAFTLAACSSAKSENSDTDSKTDNQSQTEHETTEKETTMKKTLVVYYSATGSTRKAAETIAASTKGDLFELIPVTPYTEADLNYNDENSRVSYEYHHPDERKIALETTTVDNFDEYDTVFIGYPIWWGIAAWPVNSFVEATDFTGKTVIPFCTSSSSGLGESGELLKEIAETGNWLEGMRFSSRASADEISEWINNLNN